MGRLFASSNARVFSVFLLLSLVVLLPCLAGNARAEQVGKWCLSAGAGSFLSNSQRTPGGEVSLIRMAHPPMGAGFYFAYAQGDRSPRTMMLAGEVISQIYKRIYMLGIRGGFHSPDAAGYKVKVFLGAKVTFNLPLTDAFTVGAEGSANYARASSQGDSSYAFYQLTGVLRYWW